MTHNLYKCKQYHRKIGAITFKAIWA